MGFTRGVLRGSISLCDRYTILGNIPYLLNEGFEGGTEPTGWTHVGTINYNYTAFPLDGSVSLSIAALADRAISPNAAPGSTLYSTFHFITNNFVGFNSPIYRIYATDGTTVLGLLNLGNTGKLGVAPTGGSSVYSASAVVSTGASLYIKVKYTQGTGANAVMTIWSSTEGTTWTQQATSTNGTSTAAPGAIAAVGLGTVTPIWDTIKILDTDITDARSGF